MNNLKKYKDMNHEELLDELIWYAGVQADLASDMTDRDKAEEEVPKIKNELLNRLKNK